MQQDKNKNKSWGSLGEGQSLAVEQLSKIPPVWGVWLSGRALT